MDDLICRNAKSVPLFAALFTMQMATSTVWYWLQSPRNGAPGVEEAFDAEIGYHAIRGVGIAVYRRERSRQATYPPGLKTMSDAMTIRDTCRLLKERVQREPQLPELRSVYLDLSPVIGQIQGLVAEAVRRAPADETVSRAEASLADLKAVARQVGLDIRLASPGALTMGLLTALERAEETLGWLERAR